MTANWISYDTAVKGAQRKFLRTLRLKLYAEKVYNLIDLNRKALVMTDTELKLIAAAAIIGDSSRPKNG